MTAALIGAGILGLLATLWSEWSRCRRYKAVYVLWHASDGVTGPNRRASG